MKGKSLLATPRTHAHSHTRTHTLGVHMKRVKSARHKGLCYFFHSTKEEILRRVLWCTAESRKRSRSQELLRELDNYGVGSLRGVDTGPAVEKSHVTSGPHLTVRKRDTVVAARTTRRYLSPCSGPGRSCDSGGV